MEVFYLSFMYDGATRGQGLRQNDCLGLLLNNIWFTIGDKLGVLQPPVRDHLTGSFSGDCGINMVELLI